MDVTRLPSPRSSGREGRQPGAGAILFSSVLLLAGALGLATSALAADRAPLLDLATPVVAPGEPVAATLLGPPGHAFAVAQSPTDQGLVVQGVPLALGPDARIVATGVLDAAGQAALALPPLDAPAYLQAVIAPDGDFATFTATPPKRVALLPALGATTLLLPSPPSIPTSGARNAPGPTDPAPASGPAPRLSLAARAGGVLGCLGCILADALADGVVTTAKLADAAVATAKIAPGAIDTAALGDAAVTGAKVAAGAIGAAQADLTQLQARVASCPAGRAVRSVGTDGSVTCGITAPLDPALVATLRWDLLPRAPGAPFLTGGNFPIGMAFDGTYIWVAHFVSPGTIAKLDAATGQPVPGSPFDTGGDLPLGVAFDGQYIWVTHNTSPGSVAKIDVATGLPVPGSPFDTQGNFANGVAFDGTHIWVSNAGSGTVAKLDVATGAPAAGSPFDTLGTTPIGVAFDGAFIWVANNGSGTVAKLDAATGQHASGSPFESVPMSFTTPTSLAFDGTNIWVANSNSGLSKLDAATGAPAAGSPFGIGGNPRGIAFDGAYVWAGLGGSGGVAQIDAATGQPAPGSPFATPSRAFGVLFDGASIWISNNFSPGTVAKFPAR